MKLFRLSMSTRTAGVFAALACAMPVLGVGLSAWSWTDPAARASAQRISAVTHGDLSNGALQALAARMDPAAVAVARRNDPLTARPRLRFGAATGWSDFGLTGRPNLGREDTGQEHHSAANPHFERLIHGGQSITVAWQRV